MGRTDACTFAATVRPPPLLSATRFVAFGDSITYGVLPSCPGTNSVFSLQDDLRLVIASVDVAVSYPTKLQNLLRTRYPTQSPVVLNEGLPGEGVSGTPGGVTRLPGVLSQDAPEILLLQEGVNDINFNNPALIPAVVSGLQTMIRQAKSLGVRQVLLGTLLPQREGACRGYAPGLIVPANDQIRAMALAEGAVLVDLYQSFLGMTDVLLGPDGLHPSEAGYEKMAQTFYDVIRQRLETASAAPSLPLEH
jgi:lysophospholipase L1-like esterase